MTDENLAEGLNESYRTHQREIAIKHLTSPDRRTLTLGQIAKLMGHDQHGAVLASITLDELYNELLDGSAEESAENDEGDSDEEEPNPPSAKKGGRKKAAKTAPAAAKKVGRKKAAKAAPAKKAAKAKAAPAAKKAAKAAPAKKDKASSGRNPKSDKGKPKPRLDYDSGKKEILAALKAAAAQGHESLGRGALEAATGFTGVQVRTFAKKLVEEGRVQVMGEGGRGTTYALA